MVAKEANANPYLLSKLFATIGSEPKVAKAKVANKRSESKGNDSVLAQLIRWFGRKEC